MPGRVPLPSHRHTPDNRRSSQAVMIASCSLSNPPTLTSRAVNLHMRRVRVATRWMGVTSCLLLLHSAAFPARTLGGEEPTEPSVAVRLDVRDDAGNSVPFRFRIENSQGATVAPPGLPHWRGHVATGGPVLLKLPVGRYRYRIERGPEQGRASGEWHVTPDFDSDVTITLPTIKDLTSQGWYSADLHIHRPIADVPLLLAANDLDVGPVITWWNDQNAWDNRELPTQTIRTTPDLRWIDVMAGEDERGGGALLFFRLRKPLAISGLKREWPSSAVFLRQAAERSPSWIDIEKPFWRDVPLWLASGQVNSIGIAHNHMWWNGVLDNEAWGRARPAGRYPGPHGNSLWSHDIYFHALNCGVRLPPTAGSASGVLPNPVGYNRCYVHLDEPLTYDAWWRALAEGKVFVTNGPLLLVSCNGSLPGATLEGDSSELQVEVKGEVHSRDPIDRIEIIYNGRVVKTIPSDGAQVPTRFRSVVKLDRRGWLLVRAVADVKETYRFAASGPVWIALPTPDEAARAVGKDFFLDWATERRKELADSLAEGHRGEVLQFHDEAIRFWKSLD